MASLGKDYREILDFYYPTTTLLSFYTTKYPRKEQEQEPPKDTVAPDAPSVNALGDNQTSLTGVTEPNASVIAKVENEVMERVLLTKLENLQLRLPSSQQIQKCL